MAKSLRIILLIVLIAAPIVFYKALNRKKGSNNIVLPLVQEETRIDRPQIALIFDNLGNSLTDLRQIYELGIPLTISVIPDLKFSRNIAHIGARSGFSVLINLPLEPLEENRNSNPKYKVITGDLGNWEVDSLLRHYLNFIRIAIGVNSHKGSRATQDRRLMRNVLREVKRKNLVFIDSRTSPDSVAYKIASKEGLVCGYNEDFLDWQNSPEEMSQQLEDLIIKANQKKKIIVIAHPKSETINFLKKQLPDLADRIEFITIRDYFEL